MSNAPKPDRRRGRARVTAAALLMVALLSTVPAGAEQNAQNTPDPAPGYTPAAIAEYERLAQEFEQRRDRERRWRAGREARDARSRSRTEHRGGSASAAKNLLERTFPIAVEGSESRSPESLPGVSDVEYITDNVARIKRQGRKRLLVSVGAPLRVANDGGGKAAVALNLVERQAHFEPANPVVDLRLPKRLADGFEFGERISFEPEVAPGAEVAEAQRAGGGVFYSETWADTDLYVKPITGGVETFTLIRSPQAPELQRLRFRLPEGANLRLTPEGGAQVVRGEEKLASILAPTALDAQGQAVPTSYGLDGDVLEVRVSHQGRDLAYPILADPPIIDDWWWLGGDSNFGGFTTASNHGGFSFPTWHQNQCHGAWYGSCFGLYVFAAPGGYNGNYGQWLYQAPNSTARFNYAQSWDIAARSGGRQLQQHIGIWSHGLNAWASDVGVWNAPNDYGVCNCYAYHDPWRDRAGARLLVSSMWLGGSQYRSQWSHVYTGHIRFELDDPENPDVQWVGGGLRPGGWVDSGTFSGEVNSADPGLGIQRVTLNKPGGGETKGPGCSGYRGSHCPSWWQTGFSYSTASWPDGVHQLSVDARDALDNSDTDWRWDVRVDHTAPTIASVEGGAVKPGALVAGGSHNLRVDASDVGPGNAQNSGVRNIGYRIDGGTWTDEAKSCGSGACSHTFAVDTTRLSDGLHEGEVRASDELGHGLAQPKTFTFEVDRSGPEIQTTTGPARERRYLGAQSYGLTVTAKEGSNLFPDTSFERRVPDGVWGHRASLAAVSGDPTPKHGTRMMRMSASFTGGVAEAVNDATRVGVQPGERIAMSAWIRTSAGRERDFALTPRFFDRGTHVPRNHYSTVRATSGEWRRYEHAFTVPAGITDMGWIATAFELGAGEEVYVDGVQFERADQPTPYSERKQATAGVTKMELLVDGAVAPEPVPAEPRYTKVWDCPERGCTRTHSFDLDAGRLTQGTHTVSVRVSDGFGNATTGDSWPVVVDHEPPQVTVTGDLWELRGKELFAEDYAVDVTARDGSDATPPQARSGLRRLQVLVDGTVQSDTGERPCEAGSCPLSSRLILQADDQRYEPGPHTVMVRATDQLGHEAEKAWSVNVADQDPLLTEADFVEQNHSFRDTFGLRNDDTFVRDIIHDPAYNPSRADFSVPLLPAEEEEIRSREAALDDPTVEDYGETSANGSFAGSYMDHQAGGLLRVGFTEDLAQHRGELERRMTSPSRLQVYQAAFSAAELQSLDDRLHSDELLLRSQGLAPQFTRVDVEANRLVLGVTEKPTELQRLIIDQLYGPAVQLTEGSIDWLRGRGPSRRTSYFPTLMAGMRIVAEFNTGGCTSGFVIDAPDNARSAITTAGHCIEFGGGGGGRWWEQAGARFAQVNTWTFGGYRQPGPLSGASSDGANLLGNERASTNLIYIARGNHRRVNRTQGRKPFKRGHIACLSGATTGFDCGSLTGETRTFKGGGGSMVFRTTRGLQCRKGDSGAPIFFIHEAQGLLSAKIVEDQGESSETRFCAFSHITRLADDMGFRVKTSP